MLTKLLTSSLEIQTEDVYLSALDFYSDLVSFKDDRIQPLVIARCYSNIADKNGVFYVNGIKHQIFHNELIITVNSQTKGGAPSVVTLPIIYEESATKATEQKNYSDVRYEANKRKVFVRTDIIRVSTVYDISGGVTRWNSYLTLQFHFSAQIKNVFGWNSYSASYTLESWGFSIGGLYMPATLTATQKSPGELKDWYFSAKNSDNYISQSLIPWPSVIGKLQFRGLSGGTGNCGAVCDIENGISYNRLPACR